MMLRYPIFLVLVVFFGFLAVSCEKEIIIELPESERLYVIEGSIEQGRPPIVLLSRSQGFFEPTDLNSLVGFYISGATVTVSTADIEVELTEICTSDLPEELLPLITEITGFTVEQLQQVDLCAYTSLNEDIWGEIDMVYDLRVEIDDHILTSSTKINKLIALDSVWFEITGQIDSLGFAYATLTDPDTSGNAYRWFAKRINHYPSWSEHAGEQKDPTYIAPLGSAYDDEFFNGLSFEFAYFRGSQANSNKEDDLNNERGYFKVGDTIAVRGCGIDRGAYEFIVSFENQVANQGSPFAVPSNIKTNINGGLGLWVGYAAVYDTIVCIE